MKIQVSPLNSSPYIERSLFGDPIKMPDEKEDSKSSDLPKNGAETIESGLSQFVNIKPPDFMEASVNGWFTILEAQFHLRKVSVPVTKFYSVISALPAEIVTKLPPTVLQNKNYEELKTTVLNMYEKTKPELLDKLMKATTITGRPSIYLNEMIAIGNQIEVGDDVIKHKFLQALPSTIAPVIASQKELRLDQLGKLADELMPLLAQKTTPINLAQASPANSPQQQQQFSSKIPPGVKPYSATQKPKVCRAHIYYANYARNCKPWCKWPNKSPSLQILENSRPSSRSNSRSSSRSNSPSRNESGN